ncbi:MAG: DUF2306 domain-containing protein [Actinomycetia bacterium]|nr:DUF2306 domain-containing protein [Actinomycetes bacterium]
MTRTHVVLGGLYLLWAPLQFVARIRDRHRAYHRRSGRVLIAVGLVVGVSALFLGLVIPFSGDPERVVIGVFGGMFLLALGLGAVRIRQGRIVEHREWMIRAFAIGLSVATMRLIFVPALMLTDPTDTQIVWLSVLAFTIAFTTHAVAAELWIRRTRRHHLRGRLRRDDCARPRASSAAPAYRRRPHA